MINRNGILKYKVDIWPVSIVALAFALSLLPLLVEMPLWVAAPFWVFVLWVRTHTPFAQHNQGHLPVFNSKTLNHIYDAFLTQTTGYPTALWELHHNRGHHRHFLNPERDVARIVHLDTGKTMSRWWYALQGNLTIHRDSVIIGINEGKEGKKTLLGKLAGEIVVQTIVTAGLIALNPVMAIAFFVVPNMLGAWFIWWESYPHHLEVPTQNIYDASVTIECEKYNRNTFNIGHHTAHHEKPTMHWSLLPERTAAIRSRIPETCIHGSYTRLVNKEMVQQRVVSRQMPEMSAQT